MINNSNYHKNPKVLARYIVGKGENEAVGEIFTKNTFSKDAYNAVLEMGLHRTAKAKNFAHHAQLSPHPQDDITAEKINYAIAAQVRHRGWEKRMQAWTWHIKDGRLHIHGAISAFNPDTGKMDPSKLWKNENNAAREDIEQHNGWRRTRTVNPDHESVRNIATDAWNSTNNMAAFKKAVERQGAILTHGGKDVFYLVYNGTAFPLGPKIKGVGLMALFNRFDKDALPKTKEVLRAQRQKMDRELIEKMKKELEENKYSPGLNDYRKKDRGR